jgi:N-methylhydantoinase B
MNPDPVLLEVFNNRFASIAQEMGAHLYRTAFSANIKERRDLSCAVFDGRGLLVAQAAHIPVHLGSMPLSVASALAAGPLYPGDMVAVNDPFAGGTHLPDITLVAPVFLEADDAEPAFLVANRAHHADVGGMTSGSMPLSTSLFQEGLVIPPVKLVRGQAVEPDLLKLVLANVRTPGERQGDLQAQITANTTGARRLAELCRAFGRTTTLDYARALMDYSHALCAGLLESIPDGVYEFTDHLEDDGQGTTNLAVRLKLTVTGNGAELDFRDSADACPGSLNAVRAITVSAVSYVLRCLAPGNAPVNAGLLRPVNIRTRPGSILDAVFPSAVAGGNVETSQRIVDVILGALARARPDLIPAASQGTMNNLTIGGTHPATGEPFAYYETLAGGAGGGPRRQGASAVHTHMTNTLNTPVEALEYAFPLRVERLSLARGSGGDGARRGGDGLVRQIRVLAPCEVTMLSERRRLAPWGLAQGKPGRTGSNILIRDNEQTGLGGKFSRRLEPGDALRITTPGGGGHGAPPGRSRGEEDGGD